MHRKNRDSYFYPSRCKQSANCSSMASLQSPHYGVDPLLNIPFAIYFMVLLVLALPQDFLASLSLVDYRYP